MSDEQRAEGHDEPFVVHDKRKIDPETGEARVHPAPADPAGEQEPGSSADEAAAFTEIAMAELTADLQRVQAEYANYRKRVERDRSVARDSAVADVLTALLPVLDDLQRAREHDEFSGALKSMGEALEGVARRFGLETYGEVGEVFDPEIHEALMHTAEEGAGDSPMTVVTNVFQVGYRHAGRVLRPARVVVVDRAPEA